jgi:hypothetical protein
MTKLWWQRLKPVASKSGRKGYSPFTNLFSIPAHSLEQNKIFRCPALEQRKRETSSHHGWGCLHAEMLHAKSWSSFAVFSRTWRGSWRTGNRIEGASKDLIRVQGNSTVRCTVLFHGNVFVKSDQNFPIKGEPLSLFSGHGSSTADGRPCCPLLPTSPRSSGLD